VKIRIVDELALEQDRASDAAPAGSPDDQGVPQEVPRGAIHPDMDLDDWDVRRGDQTITKKA
jgi:hypothetical protein